MHKYVAIHKLSVKIPLSARGSSIKYCRVVRRREAAMNADVLWRRIIRRTAVIASGLCCLALLTGCPWDEDDLPEVPHLWDITWVDNDPADSGSITIPVNFDDLTLIGNYSNTFGDYAVVITVNGGAINITINETTSSASLNLDGTITSTTTANGRYTGTDENGAPLDGGTWTIAKQ